MVLARAARTRVEVVLQVRVPATDLAHPVEGVLGERRAPEIGVHDDSGAVDDAAKPGSEKPVELRDRAGGQVFLFEAGPYVLACAREGGAGRREDELVTVLVSERPQALVGEQPVDRREVAERVSATHRKKMILTAILTNLQHP
jgi:hypothetical protein